MCLPVKNRDGGVDVTSDAGEGDLSLSSGLQDLEVRASPKPMLVVSGEATIPGNCPVFFARRMVNCCLRLPGVIGTSRGSHSGVGVFFVCDFCHTV